MTARAELSQKTQSVVEQDPPQAELSTEAEALFHDFGETLDQGGLDEASALLAQTDAMPRTALLNAKRNQKQADLYRELGQFAEARKLYHEARSVFLDLGRRRDWSTSAIREADMMLHLGETESARELYEDAAQNHSVVLSQQAQPTGKKNEVHLALFHLSQYWVEKHDFVRARLKLQLAWDSLTQTEADELWKARTEERIASLPNAPQPQVLILSSMDRARKAFQKTPLSRRAQMAFLRAEYRHALLSGETKDLDNVFSKFHRAWDPDKRRALLAHDYLELLMETLASYPRRTDWRNLARELLTEIAERDQFRGDVHLSAWKGRIFPKVYGKTSSLDLG